MLKSIEMPQSNIFRFYLPRRCDRSILCHFLPEVLNYSSKIKLASEIKSTNKIDHE